MGRLKEAIRGIACRAVVHTGLCALGRRFLPKTGALIFYAHRVAEDDEGYLQGLRPEWLDAQLAYLTRHYEILRLSELVRCFEERRPVPPRSAVITFDDGFRDNLINALPVLTRHGVPATIFLATGCVTKGELPWSQRLGYLFQNCVAREIAIELDGHTVELSLATPAVRRRSCLAVKASMIALPRVEREALLERCAQALNVDPPRDRMLSWEEVTAMQTAGVEFGAHTFSHPLLARIPVDEARWEMERSRDDLKERLGIERPPFCFPAGSHNAELMALVRDLGFRSVFQPAPRHRVNSLETTHQFALGRMGLPESPAVFLEAEVDGPLHPLRRALRRIWHRN